jgi:hypothetical protein
VVCGAICCWLRYRRQHIGGDFEDVVGPDGSAQVAEAGEGVPHEGIQFQRSDEAVDGLLVIVVRGVELPQYAVTCRGIGDVSA